VLAISRVSLSRQLRSVGIQGRLALRWSEILGFSRRSGPDLVHIFFFLKENEMKIDLGRGCSIQTKTGDFGKTIDVAVIGGNVCKTAHLDLDQAVALHATLGEQIKMVRRKLS